MIGAGGARPGGRAAGKDQNMVEESQARPPVNEGDVRKILAKIPLPQSDLSVLDRVVGIHLRADHVNCVLELRDKGDYSGLETEVIKALCADAAIKSAKVIFTSDKGDAKSARQRTAPDPKPVPGIATILGVASGKGGVGKSTVAVNLALAFAARGYRVGILDTDVYGPSVPTMLGLKGKPSLDKDKRLIPIQKWGIQAMSMGLLVEDNAPVVWRGPMATRSVEQMLRLTNWGKLDVLVIDMPPGTGDVALTLARTTRIDGAVLVTTPQHVSLIDVEKSLLMFRRVNVPVLGIVENMCFFSCPKCGERTTVFPGRGIRRLSKTSGIPILGEIPLSPRIADDCDRGAPTMSDPDDPIATVYKDIATRVIDSACFASIRSLPQHA